MSAVDLLARLSALDVRLHAEDGKLRVSAPKGRVTPELQRELVSQRDELLRVLTAELPALAAAPRDGGPLPLSFLQERLWLLERLQPGMTAYNFAGVLSSDVRADVARLSDALRRVVARHEILRSRYVLDGERAVARVGAADDVSIEVRDIRGLAEADRWRTLDDTADAEARIPFDLATEFPVRFVILRTAEDRIALLVSAHHIALDAWSFSALGEEIAAEYALLETGGPSRPAPALQYADFARWQRAIAEHPAAARRLAYWTERLADLPQLSTFPPDRPRLLDGQPGGATMSFRWPPELYAAVRATARGADATVYMVLVAAMTAVLARHSGQTDVAIGSPVGSRERPELENVLGPIVNPLVLRFDVADDPTFAELVRRVRDQVLEGHTNQDVPFERIVQALNPPRSLGHSPLFQVAVVLHNATVGGPTLAGGGSIYDLTLYGNEDGTTLGGGFEYRTDLYDEATVARIADRLQRLLEGATREPTMRLSELPMLDDAERALVVSRFNATAVEVDRTSVVAQFARAAAAHPDAVAVVAEDATLTYRALDERSAAVAARLRALGAGRGSFVALATERGSALPVAALGILRSGAAYVPVDPTYPADRIALMLRDSGAQQVVTSRALAPALRDAAATVVVIEDLADGADPRPADDGAPAPDDVAYLMYTSGSTGTPKGVLVPHGAVSNFLGAMRERLGVGPADAVLSVTSPSFDISVLELFLPLVQGARTIVAGRETVADGARLAALVRTSGATVVQSTPSGWRLLVRAGWEGSAAVTAIAGGEPLTQDLVDWLRPRTRAIWNGYGPTETTVYSTMARIEPGDPITIGTPVANTRVYVLDGRGEPVPVGVAGEIYIAGAGVAHGYHARPDLTASRFVPDLVEPGATMYRTGDAGRWRTDGRLEHLGRLDGQVKVRGHRIELGEIEAALATHELVATAIAGVQAIAADDRRIVAWVQFRDDEDCTPSELRRHLRQRLPEFMIPAMIVPVDAIPLTPNGKVDRRALPDPFATGRAAPVASPPSTPTERMIAEVWMRLLRVPQVSTTDGFFDLGGHSLLAMRAAGEITARTGRPIEPRLLFFRTLGQLAEACDAAPGTGA